MLRALLVDLGADESPLGPRTHRRGGREHTAEATDPCGLRTSQAHRPSCTRALMRSAVVAAPAPASSWIVSSEPPKQ